MVLGYLHTPEPDFEDSPLAATPPRAHRSSTAAGSYIASPAPTWQPMYDGGGGQKESDKKKSSSDKINATETWRDGAQVPHHFDIDILQDPTKYGAETFRQPMSGGSLNEPPTKATPQMSAAPSSPDLDFESDYLGRLDMGLASVQPRSLFNTHTNHHTPPSKHRSPNAARPWTAPPSYAFDSDRVAGLGKGQYGDSIASLTQDKPIDSWQPRTAHAASVPDVDTAESMPRYSSEDHASAVREKLDFRSPLVKKSGTVGDDSDDHTNRSFVEELNDSGGLPTRPSMAKVTPDKTFDFQL